MEKVTTIDNPEACNTCEMHLDYCVCEAVKEVLEKTVINVDSVVKEGQNIIYVNFQTKKRETT